MKRKKDIFENHPDANLMANHLQSKINPATDELSHPNNLSLPRRSVSNRVLNDFTNCCMTPTTTVNNPKRGIGEYFVFYTITIII